MKNKSIYELGKLAPTNDMAMLEIINRKRKMLKKYSFGSDDCYQYKSFKTTKYN